MQPFGLLNFLKFALQPPEDEKGPPQDKTTEVKNAPSQKNEGPGEPSTEETAPNACQLFLENHERRARRLKKDT